MEPNEQTGPLATTDCDVLEGVSRVQSTRHRGWIGSGTRFIQDLFGRLLALREPNDRGRHRPQIPPDLLLHCMIVRILAEIDKPPTNVADVAGATGIAIGLRCLSGVRCRGVWIHIRDRGR